MTGRLSSRNLLMIRLDFYWTIYAEEIVIDYCVYFGLK